MKAMLETDAQKDHRSYLDFIPLGLICLNTELRITIVNRYAMENLHSKQEEVVGKLWHQSFPGIELPLEPNTRITVKTLSFSYGDEYFVGQVAPSEEDGRLTGYTVIFQNSNDLEEVTKELNSYKQLNADLKAIFDTSYDVIYVSDGEGNTVRVSSACETLWGYKESELIGKNVYQLEKEGVFNPSVTRMVLEKKHKITSIQTTKTGRRLMVVGTPIKDEEGKIIRIVNASRDITEISQLQMELEMFKQLTEGYRQELDVLRKQNETDNKLVYRSEKTKRLVTLSEKVAGVDTPVLLLGEPGVGKEVVAGHIHKWSKRRKNPFITLNCGGFPESLLEYELFGSEEAGTDDASRVLKRGLFEMANEGTLFLDEIAELPMALQAKLLRVMKDNEIMRVGGKKPIPINVRLIAATHHHLEDAIKAGKFREDLYYRLNVVPISVPPLRERKEDILPLILHFKDLLNKKYGMDKQFSSSVVEKLQSYSWPGNVQELQNVIERLLVTTDGNLINSSHLPDHLLQESGKYNDVQVNRIIPLREAVEAVEKGLLEMAQQKYSSTTKIAEILGVNQSTISRKIQQYKKK
ncbi:sigma 54-interacting transcriptional regulator [Ferviditalea candida]|uniref:HTH-type transcriptional regulatory protein TyrR n=1 Tax=Ferviditalea candida TaxID=3108399 RepID=A0ABU5ZJC4_9BACL|nr:sigma 54-interacting transcriptional regulator [Paenibacillaceae bacterium T2]